MRRKDGKPKARAKRNLPEFDGGFRDHFPLAPLCAKRASVISFFSGCGGLDLGFQGGFHYLGEEFEPLPFELLGAYDNLADAVEAYRLNIGPEIENCDLSKADMSEFPRADVVIGGFPCQDFSSSGPKVGLNGERGQLYTVIRDYLTQHQPKAFVAENVPYLIRLEGGKYLEQIVGEFADCGYRVGVWELNCPDFGLGQSRKRVIIMGVRNDLSGFLNKPVGRFAAKHRTIDEAIGDLEDVTDESVTNQSQYFIASKATAGGGQGDHKNSAGSLAYCIRANSRGRIQFHHHLDRRLTVRECARLQSFPDKFAFPFTTQRNLTLIGNAVPPIVGHAVARSLADFLERSERKNSVGNAEVVSDIEFQKSQLVLEL